MNAPPQFKNTALYSAVFDAEGALLYSDQEPSSQEPSSTDVNVFPLHGDGVFETLLVSNKQLPFWSYHRARLEKGLAILKISCSISSIELALMQEIEKLEFNACFRLRLQVFRATSSAYQGYQCDSAKPFFRLDVFALRAADKNPIRLCESSLSLAPQAELAGIKHCNRLIQVLAAEDLSQVNAVGESAFDEALMFDQMGNLISAISANVFLSIKGCWITPLLDQVGVEGTTRQWLLEEGFRQLDREVFTRTVDKAQLLSADSLFICNAIRGVVPVESVFFKAGEQKQFKLCDDQNKLAASWKLKVGIKA